MTDPTTFLPLYSETIARIRARMDADVNAGLLATDAAYVDTRQGSFYWDLTQVCALEMARIWDALGSETVAAAFPSIAWGDYLDQHGATFQLVRLQAEYATGTVLFIGGSNTLIGAGTEVSAPPVDPSMDAVTFATLADGTTATQLTVPAGVTVTPLDTGGTLSPGAYIYHVTAYNSFGETTGSADQTGTISTSIGKNTIAWSAVSGAAGYRVYRTLIPNDLGQMIADRVALSFVDVGAVTPSILEPTSNTTAGARIAVQAQNAGSAGNLAAGAVTQLATYLPGIAAVSNEIATSGGSEVESDDDFRLRILAQFQGQGAGSIADYQRWTRDAGIPRVAVVPVASGPGTVLVVTMNRDGTPVSGTVVSALQAELDPVAGQGHGKAPIGAAVTVVTTAPLSVTIAATVVHATGYSLDGLDGTLPTRPQIEAALGNYLTSLDPGDTIVFQVVRGLFFSSPGVVGTSALTVNTGVIDIPLATTPAQTAILVTPTSLT